MANSEQQFRLPGQVDTYLAALNHIYSKKGAALLREIVVNGIVSIEEARDYDDYDGGTYTHAITLAVPTEVFLRARANKDDLQSRIATDINELDNTKNEYVGEVFIEMTPPDDGNWREESGVYHTAAASPSVPDDALQRIWGQNRVRLFLSHKATVKSETSTLKQALTGCGLAAFVAHEDIEPTQEWQREIERALFSMDALVALLTPDFHDSYWTDQEVGVAIGRGVPIIAVRLGLDPYGLMGKGQGLGGCDWADTHNIAIKVFQLLHKRLADKSRLFECALTAYAASDSFEGSGRNVQHFFSPFESLTSLQVERLLV